MSKSLWQMGAQIADSVGPWSLHATRSKLHEQGAKVRKRAGIGTDFWQYRPLGDGESSNRIDWRKSARSDDVLVRERERQTPSPLTLWCDRSASMVYKSNAELMTKLDYAYTLAASLVQCVALADDRATALIDSPQTTPRQDLAMRLEEQSEPVLQRIPDNQLVVMISDFLMPEEFFKNFADTHHDFIFVHVCDPYEVAFPFLGRVQFSGYEHEADVLLDKAEAAKADYCAAFEALSLKIATIGRYVRADTSQSLADTVRTIIS